MHHTAADILRVAAALDSYLPLLNDVEIWREQTAANRKLQKIAGPALDDRVFEVGNDWLRNISLRREVSRLWQEAVEADNLNFAFDLARWIVKDWGGIKNINDSTISEHHFAALNKLFSLPFEHISSKSKIITLPDSYTYQIYDARVAVALNVIQLAANTEVRIYFEIPQTQITWIAGDGDCFYARMPKQLFVEDFDFKVMNKGEIYSYYTKLLSKLGINMQPQLDPIEVEMALFGLAKAFSTNANGVLTSVLAAERVRLRAGRSASSV